MHQDVLEQVYRQYYRQVYLYALSLSRNVALAEDLTSDTFFKAFLSLEQSGGNIKLWLLRVCKNLWFDHLRKSKRLDAIPPEERTDLKSEDNTLEALLESEKNSRLYAAIHQLPAAQREAVTLFYFGGLHLKEIASILNMGEGATRTLVYRSRRRLKDLLKEEEQ